MDIHLDTSWCPVCDRLILPKRYTVPVAAPPLVTASNSNTAIKSSQTTRGKHGTIKARGGAAALGGGLLQGTGRVRPGGGLRPNKAKSPLRQEQQQIQQIQQALADSAPVRTRTVIDQAQTPLYCSEACRKADLEWSWPAAPAAARVVLEADEDSHREAEEERIARRRLGAHPAQLNPAQASPPPLSPVLPPVPPNSWRAPGHKDRELDLSLPAAVGLRLSISENDGEQSDSSSATGTSFTASDRSPTEKLEASNLYTDPAPPPLAPLPLHPHRPAAPVALPRSDDDDPSEYRPLFEGGLLMAAKRLHAMYFAGVANDEQMLKARKEREEKERRDDERKRRWDLTGERFRDGSHERDAARRRKESKQRSEIEALDPLKWSEVVYNYGGKNRTSGTPGVVSTHRRSSDSTDAKNTAAVRRMALRGPSRTQSALELYAKYPLFARTPSSSSSHTSTRPATRIKSTASLVTTCAPAYGVSTLSTSPSVPSSSSSVSTVGLMESSSALTLPGADPVLYAGKKLSTPRRALAKGAEGKLLVPDVLLRPIPAPVSSSLPAAGLASAAGMKRSGSETSVSHRSGGRNGRSTSALGAVREEGVWHRSEEDSRSEGRSSTTSASAEERNGKGNGRSSRHGSKAPSELSAPERRRMNMEARNWSYDNVEGPVYDAMPAVPTKQTRFEELFVPDSLIESSLASGIPPDDTEGLYIAICALHTRDVELSRRAVREVGRRRGAYLDEPGWWVEKEWEVTVIPERKRLFLFGSGAARTQ